MQRYSQQPPAIFIMGPTAAGKTEAAIQLSQTLPMQLISVDSAQVYRGLDIGSAKPDKDTLAQAPHRLLDVRDPEDTYSAADFATDAQREMKASSEAGKIPLLVGGTMLYFRALQQGLNPLPAADAGIRRQIEAEAEQSGWPALHRRLAQADPDSAARISPNDGQRIQRALEIYHQSGRSMSQWLADTHPRALPYRLHKIVISSARRSLLHQRIGRRFQWMLEHGFLEEVEALRQRPGLTQDHASMRSVGYRQAWQYLAAGIDFETFCRQARSATRQLAKRQLTWLRAETNSVWYDFAGESDYSKIFKGVRRFLETGN